MIPPRKAVPSPFAGSVVAVCAGMLVLASGLVMFVPSANALPPASGSKCSSNWVNDAGAMQCFIQGEEDVHHGVTHPHYVACTAAGEVFCCVNDNNGNQNCEAQASKGRTTDAQKIRAILAAQRAMIKAVERPPGKAGPSEVKTTDPNRKSSP